MSSPTTPAAPATDAGGSQQARIHPRSISFTQEELSALTWLKDTHRERYSSMPAVLQDYSLKEAVAVYRRALALTPQG